MTHIVSSIAAFALGGLGAGAFSVGVLVGASL